MKQHTLAVSGMTLCTSVLAVVFFSAPSVSATSNFCNTIPESGPAVTEEVSSISGPSNFCTDGDGDGVATTTENDAPAHTDATGSTEEGDHNGDGTQDSRQSQVASLPNPNDQEQPGSYVTLEVLPNDDESSSHWKIKQFGPTPDEVVEASDDVNLPVGLFDLKLENKTLEVLIAVQDALKCEPIRNAFLKAKCLNLKAELADKITAESQANVRLLFDRVLDHSDWTVQQYVNGVLTNYTAIIQDEVVGFLRTTITWTLTDGGDGDLDGLANGKISDPIGPTVPVKTAAVVTTAAAVNAPVATPVKTALASTGTNSLLISAIAVVLLAASLYVARAKQNV